MTAGLKHENTTMCIIHKGFSGFIALSSASILVGNLIGLKHAIPYEIIHETLGASRKNPYCVNAISRKVFGKPAPNKC